MYYERRQQGWLFAVGCFLGSGLLALGFLWNRLLFTVAASAQTGAATSEQTWEGD